MTDNLNNFNETVKSASKILILQPENPDGDSVSSALALEQILSELGKEVYLFTAVQIPRHLRHLEGWDRISEDPTFSYDLSIIVDTSTESLLQRPIDMLGQGFTKKPIFVIDHHALENDFTFDVVDISYDDAVATGEAIYEIATELQWPLDSKSAEYLASSILYDSLGLTTEGTTARSIEIVAELVRLGASIPKLNNARRELNKRDKELTAYKGQLISRIRYELDGKLALIHIPWEEIQQYSDRYNPSVLVMDEMLLTIDVLVAVSIKTYPDGKLTAKIRSNYGHPIAKPLAEAFGGGGHPNASGFKIQPGDYDKTIAKIIEEVGEITKNETV